MIIRRMLLIARKINLYFIMFTGIVKFVGSVVSIALSPSKNSKTMGVFIKTDLLNVQLGDSVAIAGACLTVVRKDVASGVLFFDISHETLTKTNLGILAKGSRVNVEFALKANEPLGGHFVSCHVDEVGRIMMIEKQGESWNMWLEVSQKNMHYVVPKGSIVVDGVSLTVNEVVKNKVMLTIIPHTWQFTTLSSLNVAANNLVNVEFDMFGKYICNYMDAMHKNDERVKNYRSNIGNKYKQES